MKTQDQICQATGLTARNLKKIVKSACDEGRVGRAATCGAGTTKGPSLTVLARRLPEDLQPTY